MAKAMLIKANGLVEVVDFPETGDKLHWYYDMLGCDMIDVAYPYGIENLAKESGLTSLIGKYCMIVDDEGLLKGEPQVNPIASLMYGCDDHGQPLVGDVLVCKNEVTEDGIDSVGMDELDISTVLASVNALIERHNEKVREARERD